MAQGGITRVPPLLSAACETIPPARLPCGPARIGIRPRNIAFPVPSRRTVDGLEML